MAIAQTNTASIHMGRILGGVRAILSRLVSQCRATIASIVARTSAVTPDRWFVLLFVLLVLIFVVVLLVQPSGVGRGGR